MTVSTTHQTPVDTTYRQTSVLEPPMLKALRDITVVPSVPPRVFDIACKSYFTNSHGSLFHLQSDLHSLHDLISLWWIFCQHCDIMITWMALWFPEWHLCLHFFSLKYTDDEMEGTEGSWIRKLQPRCNSGYLLWLLLYVTHVATSASPPQHDL